jgi:transposase
MNCSKLASALKAPETRQKMSSRVLKASAPAPKTQNIGSKAYYRLLKALKTSWQKGRPNPFSRVFESGKSFVRTLMRHASQV